MRIIAGSVKGSKIFSPKGQDTRPTQDRVRESLFNILQAHVPEASVLDLFAGSGALALEAVSRGAASATLADFAQDAVVCIQRNIAKLGFESRTKVLKCVWQEAVLRLAAQGCVYDLVFLDPPYGMTGISGIMERLASAGLLAADALVVAEHGRGAVAAEHPQFTLIDRRGYGDTEVSFFRHIEQEGKRCEEAYVYTRAVLIP